MVDRWLPVATLFAGGGPPVVHQWLAVANAPSDCRLRAPSGPTVAFLPLIATGGPLE